MFCSPVLEHVIWKHRLNILPPYNRLLSCIRKSILYYMRELACCAYQESLLSQMPKAGMHTPTLGAHLSWAGGQASQGCTALGAWLWAASSQVTAFHGPELVSAATSWPCLLDKNPFPLHSLEREFVGARLWYSDHSNMDKRGIFVSLHTPSWAKHLPKSRVTHRVLGKERCKPCRAPCLGTDTKLKLSERSDGPRCWAH